MKCLLAIFALFVAANARSLPVDRPIVDNPCTKDSLYTLRYYQPYPGDEVKFVECNPWGFYTIRSCDVGFVFNSWLMSCVRSQQNIEEKLKDILPTLEQVEVPMNVTMVKPVCSFYGNNTCLNGGICNFYLDGFSKCLCLSGYTGKFCEIEDALSRGVFGEIINRTFSLELYKKQRPLLNDSIEINITMDASIQWDEAAKQKISQYLALFPNQRMRFDQLITYLVEDFVSQLYPTSFYLQEFNYETELETGLSGAIPNLLMTAKYSYDNFVNFMNVFDGVLNNLVDYLLMKEKSIKTEAQLFYEVYDDIFKAIESTTGEEKEKADGRTDLSREDMVLRIHKELNRTLSKSYELYLMANNFDLELAIKGENYTTEEVVYAIGNFSLSPDVVRLMTEIHEVNGELWDSLSFYGFWYVLSSFVEVPEDMDSSLKQPYIVGEPVAAKVVKNVDEDDVDDDEDENLMTTPVKRSVDTVTPTTTITTENGIPVRTTTGVKRMDIETPVTTTTGVKRMDIETPVTTTTGVKRMDIETPVTTTTGVKRMDIETPVTTTTGVKRMDIETPVTLTTTGVKRMDIETPVTLTTTGVKRMDIETPVTLTTTGVKRMDIETSVTLTTPVDDIESEGVKRMYTETTVGEIESEGVKRMDIETPVEEVESEGVKRMYTEIPTTQILTTVERSEKEIKETKTPEELTTLRPGVKRMEEETIFSTLRPAVVERMDDGSIIIDGETTPYLMVERSETETLITEKTTTEIRRDVPETLTTQKMEKRLEATPEPNKRNDEMMPEDEYIPDEEEEETEISLKKRVTHPAELPEIIESPEGMRLRDLVIPKNEKSEN